MKKISFILMLLFSLVAMQMQAATTHCFWGYCNSKVSGEFGSKTKAKGAIYIPADIAQLYKGKTISFVKVGLAAMANSVNVFITKDLNGTSITTKKAGMLYNGWNEVKLSSPYTIDGEAFYIGYSYEGDNASMGRSEMYSENGCWADLGDGWKNYATEKEYKALALTIQAKISGENMPKDLWIYSNRDFIVKKGAPCKLPFGIMNMSPRVARNLQVGYSIDGGAETVADFKTTMGANTEKEFSFDHPGFNESKTHTIKFRLISVDGAADSYSGNDTVTSKIKVMDAVPRQRFVVEEGTGTWCGWCPMGIVALDQLSKKYPETFIGIAVHKSDPLQTTSYNSMSFSGYPKCYINRNLDYPTQPEASGLEASHNKAVAIAPNVGVEVKAEFTDASKKKINAKALTTFFTAQNGLKYRISFVLVENGIKGYTQANYFAGGGQGNMGGFESLPSYASIDMDHVARMNYSYEGFKESVPTSVQADETTEYAAVLNVPASIQHADSLHLVALLINSKGLIENAAQVKVLPDPVTGITDNAKLLAPEIIFADGRFELQGFNGTMTVYNSNGQIVPNSSLPRGIYVVKVVAENTSFVRKMFVK
jgi:hypothetical protein